MRARFGIGAVFLVALAGLTAAASSRPLAGDTRDASDITVRMTPHKTALFVNDTTRITAVAVDSKGHELAGRKVSWQSSDDTIARVAPSGQVTALRPGRVVISANVSGVRQSVTLTVNAATLEPTFNGLTGYFTAYPQESPDIREDGWGVSMYSAIHPVKPGRDDWTQLGWATWMLANPYEDENGVWDPIPRNPDDSPVDLCPEGASLPGSFQSMEGGIGSWGNVKFPIESAMFLMKIDGTWTPIPPSEVPDSTLLKDQTFPQLPVGSVPPLDTSEASPWASSRWAAGPFRTPRLGNGTIVDYVWYRFVDQPAIGQRVATPRNRAIRRPWPHRAQSPA